MDVTDYIPRETQRHRTRKRTRQELWRDFGLYLPICMVFLAIFLMVAFSNGGRHALLWALFALLTVGALAEIVVNSRTSWKRPRFWWKVGLVGVVQTIAFALFLLLVEPFMNRALWKLGAAMDLCALVSLRRWMRR